ncbi:MAG TPA: chemotaxis protein [Thiotrichales bacterium]|nr:chemotaxis protein [Thiotrichales bacterium]
MLKHADRKVILHPGDFCFTRDNVHIHTLLGSCIAITLWHPELKVGGMCHFTLPRFMGKRPPGAKLDGRYAEDVLKMFKLETAKYKTDITEYEAKIFGGGNMMREQGENVDDTVGTRNAAAAMQLLMAEGVNILVAAVGEFGHRRLLFDVPNGEVWVRHIQKDADSNIANGIS